MSTKTCTQCGEKKPATTEYFVKCSRVKSGLSASCKVCQKAYREEPANKKRILEYNKRRYHSNKEARSAEAKIYRAANKEKIAAYRKAYQEDNKEKLRAKGKAWREANKEKKAATDKAYREANKEKIAAYQKAYRQANKERLSAQAKTWRENNREKKAARDKAYREANKEHVKNLKEEYYKTPQGKFSRIKIGAKQRGLLFELDYEYYEKNLWGKPCHYCKTEVPSNGTKAIGLDRKDSNGGYTHENVVPCCWSCNTKKQATPYDEFVTTLADQEQPE